MKSKTCRVLPLLLESLSGESISSSSGSPSREFSDEEPLNEEPEVLHTSQPGELGGCELSDNFEICIVLSANNVLKQCAGEWLHIIY